MRDVHSDISYVASAKTLLQVNSYPSQGSEWIGKRNPARYQRACEVKVVEQLRFQLNLHAFFIRIAPLSTFLLLLVP